MQLKLFTLGAVVIVAVEASVVVWHRAQRVVACTDKTYELLQNDWKHQNTLETYLILSKNKI